MSARRAADLLLCWVHDRVSGARGLHLDFDGRQRQHFELVLKRSMLHADKLDRVPPEKGQRFLDKQGVHWLVRAVTLSQNLDGFFMVHLASGKTRACDHELWVLGRREYSALCKERGLTPVGRECAS